MALGVASKHKQKKTNKKNKKKVCNIFVYLHDLLQVTNVNSFRFDHFHHDAVHVGKIVAASIVAIVFLLLARMLLLRCFRAGRSGTAHAAVARIARVPQVMEIAVDGVAPRSSAG